MPLAQPLAELRRNLEAQIRDSQLPEALNALLAQLPEGSETNRIVSALIARLNAANKERYRNTISTEEYQRRVDQVSADFFDLLAGLTDESFEVEPSSVPASAKATAGKQGNVLYRVPNVMPLQKPTRCTIRVAVDEDAILENIVLDEHVEMKSRVEISDVMRAELVDPDGGVFHISPLNAPNQLVRDTGYTEWNFSVTPLREGVHQLLVKVSIMEIVPGYPEPIPRDVSVMETVTIVTEGLSAVALAKEDVDFKPSGQSFAFQSTSTAQGLYEINYSKSVDAPANPPITSPPSPAPIFTSPPAPQATAGKKSTNRGLRALALFLAFIVLAPAATWAIAPKLDRELFLATLQTNLSGDPAPLDEFIQDHQENPDARPYLDKAYFRKAEKTDSLIDLRVYQREFGADGKYRLAVLQKIETKEIKAVERIQAQPNALNIRQFVANFPESERLPEIKKAVDTRAELRVGLLPVLEEAYVTSVQAKPSETKVAAYLRDFPKHERLNEVAEAAASKPEVLEKARPILQEAITRKVEAATTADQVRQVLPALESAGSSATATKVEKLVEQKPLIRQQLRQQVRQSGDRVRQKSGGDFKSLPDFPKSEQLPENSTPKELGLGSSTPSEQPPATNENRPRRSGLEMIPVAGGTFTMGSPKSEGDRSDNECQHQVTVKSFSIGKYEVSQADWFEILGSKFSRFQRCDECPVEGVSWNDVQDFLQALNKKHPGKNFRLPTEAEWEYAARGGNKSQGYKYAGSNDLKKVAWYSGNSGSKTHRVGELAANELGLYDMSGNVWEWCQDKYRPYPGCSSPWETSTYRVLRGGSWGSDGYYLSRVARRNGNVPNDRGDGYGFRCAQDY